MLSFLVTARHVQLRAPHYCGVHVYRWRRQPRTSGEEEAPRPCPSCVFVWQFPIDGEAHRIRSCHVPNLPALASAGRRLAVCWAARKKRSSCRILTNVLCDLSVALTTANIDCFPPLVSGRTCLCAHRTCKKTGRCSRQH